MANLLEYGLLLTADLVIIGCVVHYFVSALHWHSLPIDEAWRHRSTLARLDKLKMYSYYAVLWVGIGLALYGSLRFLFSWMPHRWVDDNGNWIGMFPSIMGAFFGMGALVSGLGQTVDKISKLQFCEKSAEAFEKLIEYELTQFGQVLRAQDAKFRTDLLAKLEHKIDEAYTGWVGTIRLSDVRACHSLLDMFRTTLNTPPMTV